MSEVIDGPIDDLERAISRTLGGRVKAERRRLGLTLQELAGRSGLSLGMVSKVENAQASPSLRTLARLAQGLDVPVTTFFHSLGLYHLFPVASRRQINIPDLFGIFLAGDSINKITPFIDVAGEPVKISLFLR